MAITVDTLLEHYTHGYELSAWCRFAKRQRRLHERPVRRVSVVELQ